MTDTPLIQLVDVTKMYHLESGDFTALDHVSLEIRENDFVAIMGPSGSGKSTMMNQLGSWTCRPRENCSSRGGTWLKCQTLSGRTCAGTRLGMSSRSFT